MRRARHTKIRTWFASALVVLLSACVAQTLPGAVGDPQSPPGEPADVPMAGSGEGVLVEYFAFCRGCTVQFSTPEGMGAADEIDGRFRRRVTFSNTAASGAVTFTVRPVGSGRVQSARILLEGTVAAEVGVRPAGEPATLTAMLR